MASLERTKSRIKSVEATKKITKAMELVSSAKLRKAKEIHEAGVKVRNLCADDLAAVVHELAIEAGLDEYIEKDEQAKTLYIVIASDMGLCGGYNTNVAKEAFNDSKVGDEFILIGNKIQPYFKTKNAKIKNVYENISKDPKLFDMYYITKEALEMFRNKEVGNVKLVYTTFVNSVTFNPTIYSLIPVVNPYERLDNPLDIAEGTAMDLMHNLVRDFFSMNIYTAIIESRVCEYASSRMAMENATDNANEIRDNLLLEYNRVRQANITQEISEIVAGADAL